MISTLPRLTAGQALPVTRTVAGVLAALNLVPENVIAKEALWFPPALISGAQQNMAELGFLRLGGQMPGTYEVDIRVNGERRLSRPVTFRADEESPPGDRDGTGLIPCLTAADWATAGVREDILQRHVTQFSSVEQDCLRAEDLSPDVTATFGFQKMQLDLSIPRTLLATRPRGEIPPERWDEGISAAFLNYNLSGLQAHTRSRNSHSHYLTLGSGVNLGPWRLRDNRTRTQRSTGSTEWKHGSTFVERAIIPWRSRLTLGDGFTPAEIFDATGFRGAQLMSEDSMWPDSRRGYAPVIRGTATANARVVVRQNGYLIYQMNVAPGPFEIEDLGAMYAGGDLEVTITEAGGAVQTFTVPYATVPLLQREGSTRYSLTAGHFRSTGNGYDDPGFIQGSLLWGLPYNVTLYGGTQYAPHYQAGAAGLGLNMGRWGALSSDVTVAESVLADESRHHGHSLRLNYGQAFSETGTTFTLAGYRYSSDGFFTLDDTALKRMSGWRYDTDEDGNIVRSPDNYYNLHDSKKDRLQASITQRLGRAGTLNLNGSHQRYRNAADTTSLQTSFNSMLGPVNYSLSWGVNRTAGFADREHTASLALSVPLRALLPGSRASTTARLTTGRDANGQFTQQAGLSGQAMAQNNLGWAISQGWSRQDRLSTNSSLNYRGAYGQADIGYSWSDAHRQLNYGIAGSAIAHRDGLTLGQPAGDTSILVAAPGAAALPVENSNGVRTDSRGFAIRPYATPYRENRLALDVGQLDDHTELDNNVSRVVPTRGAIVRANFRTASGIRALFTLTHDGKPVPFGAMVTAGAAAGMAGDDGEVFLSGLTDTGVLKAQWGPRADQQCYTNYTLNEGKQAYAITLLRLTCR